MSLKILMADDHKKQIDSASRALRKLGHDVHDIYKYDEAEKQAQENVFDIAVIDLGWYDDPYLKSAGMTFDQRAEAGYELIDLVKKHNPDAVRIIYSVHANEKAVIQTAAMRGIICVQKIPKDDPASIHGHKYLEYVVTTIATILSNKKELKAQVSLEEKKFKRVLTVVVSMLIATFALFIASWKITNQADVAVYAFGSSAFTTLVVLLALRIINKSDVEILGNLLKSILGRSEK